MEEEEIWSHSTILLWGRYGEVGTQFWPCSSHTRPGKWQKWWLNVPCSLKYAEKPQQSKEIIQDSQACNWPWQDKGRFDQSLFPISPMTMWLTPSQKENVFRNILYSGHWHNFWRKLPSESLQDVSTIYSHGLVWDTKCLYHREIFPQGGKPQHWFSLLDWCFCIFQVQWNCSSPSKMEEDERKDNKLIYFKIKIKINTSQAVPNGRGSDVIC